MKKLPKKHITRLEVLLRQNRKLEAGLLRLYGPCDAPASWRGTRIKDIETLEAVLAWIGSVNVICPISRKEEA